MSIDGCYPSKIIRVNLHSGEGFWYIHVDHRKPLRLQVIEAKKAAHFFNRRQRGARADRSALEGRHRVGEP